MLAAALAAALAPWASDWLTSPPPASLLAHAHFGETVDDDLATLRTLPHRWQADCPQCRTVWYRFDIAQAELPRDAQAIYLPVAAQNAAVYLNGRLLGSGGRFSDPAARLGQRPLLLSAPVPLWAHGDNRLYVLMKAERPRSGHLGAVALAPELQLQALERWRSMLVVTLPQVLATAAAMLGLVMGVLWFYRRRERDYAVLALATLAWALHAYSALVVEPPWPAPWWDAWLSLTLMAAAWTLLALAQRLAVETGPRSGAPWPAAATLLFGAAAAWEPQGLALDAARLLALAIIAAAGAVVARAGWQQDDGRLLVPGAALALLGVGAAAAGLLPYAAVPLSALPLGTAIVFGAAGWLLLLRFVQTLNAVEVLNIDLEALVQARTTELQAQFERVRDLERHRVIATERERLMRDMHDGVGGNLVSLLAMIEADPRRPGELATVVRDALDDMRLLVDSLDPVDDDLNAVLAMFRDRLAPRLRGARVVLHWDVELLPPVPGLTPARVLHVLRVLQEAVSNALRHGHARTLWISTAAADDVVRVTVRDDGAGFDEQTIVAGRGLKNMRRRAAEVGAELNVDSAPGSGATLTLVLPLA